VAHFVRLVKSDINPVPPSSPLRGVEGGVLLDTH